MRQRNTGGGEGTETSIASISFAPAARHRSPSERALPFYSTGKPVLPVANLPVRTSGLPRSPNRVGAEPAFLGWGEEKMGLFPRSHPGGDGEEDVHGWQASGPGPAPTPCGSIPELGLGAEQDPAARCVSACKKWKRVGWGRWRGGSFGCQHEREGKSRRV